LDGENEPSPPAVDSEDEFPTNLPSYSDTEVSQSDSSFQPEWKDGYWRFDGDRWESNNIGEKIPPKVTFAVVAEHEEGDKGNSGQFIYSMYGPNQGDNTRHQIRWNDSQDKWQTDFLLGSNQITTNLNAAPEGEKFIIVVSFNGPAKEVKAEIISPSVNVYDEDNTTNGSFQNEVIDHEEIGSRLDGANTFHGNVYEFLKFERILSRNELHSFIIPYLQEKHGLNDKEPFNSHYDIHLPYKPDVHLDAKRDPTVPGADERHTSPGNKAVSEVFFEEDDERRPTYEGDQWDFSGKDEDAENWVYETDEDLFVPELSCVFVGERTDNPTRAVYSVIELESLSTVSDQFAFRVDDTDRIEWSSEDNGRNLTINDLSVPFIGGLSYSRNRQILAAYNEGDFFYQIDNDSDSRQVWNNFHIGGHPGSFPMYGKINELIVWFDETLTLNQMETQIFPALEEKWL
jgi:hypothetical protein